MSSFETTATEATETASNNSQSQDLVVGCVLAVCGNLLISISLNLQKYIHVKNEEAGLGEHYTTSPLWWLGLVLMGVGELGNFSAYGFAPASLVAPLGTTTVIANMFIAVIFLKEKLRPEDIFGCTLAGVGAFLLVNFSQKDEDVLTADQIIYLLQQTGFLVYIVIEVTGLIVLCVLCHRYQVDNVLVLLLITSLLASFTVISAKAVSSMFQLTVAGQMQLDTWVFWFMLVIMIVTAAVQVKYLNSAMKSFNATVVVPTNFVFFTISAIVAGIIFYREFWGMSAVQIVMFLFGCIMCFGGVYFITAGRAEAQLPPQIQEDVEETVRKSKQLEGSGKIYTNILPTWLLSSVSQQEVQPRRDTYRSFSDDRSYKSKLGSSVSESWRSNLSYTHELALSEPEGGISNLSYGATDTTEDKDLIER